MIPVETPRDLPGSGISEEICELKLGWPMFKLVAPRNLGPIPAAATTAFVVLAIFAWTERTVLVDPEHMSVPYWPWKLWQIGPLLMGFVGVWWV